MAPPYKTWDRVIHSRYLTRKRQQNHPTAGRFFRLSGGVFMEDTWGVGRR